MNRTQQADITIIGAGLAGLACACHLHRAGVRIQVLEASDHVGGRIRTDIVAGHQLDRGFQVFITGYPEAKQMLDYQQLHLQMFEPGAMIRWNKQFYRLVDPWRRPFASLPTLLSPVGTLGDKIRIDRLRKTVSSGTLEELFDGPNITTLQLLQQFGFSPQIIGRFFRPFFGGIFLDNSLDSHANMMRFVFRMFANSDATLPKAGMQAIPQQLANQLPPETIRFNCPVRSIANGCIYLENGEVLVSPQTVVAVEGAALKQFIPDYPTVPGQSVTCLYFTAPKAPFTQPYLVLNGEGSGVINNLAVLSNVVPEYAPPDRALISVSVLGNHALEEILPTVKQELHSWYGVQTEQWELLKHYQIPYALPRQHVEDFAKMRQLTAPLPPNVQICGDHTHHGSIQGALESGRRAAELALQLVPRFSA
ncbi:MAG: NAD(P)/FAD-dependent oxidoreductase [Zavarzinella sp.]